MATRGFENFTATDAARHALKHVRKAIAGPQKPNARRSKYGAVKVTIDGQTFDSKREGARYVELASRQRSGVIRKLRRQHSFTLDVVRPNGELVQVGTYRSDFDYEEAIPFGGWAWVVEDVKGMRTDIYKWKRRHVEAQYAITITEIR